jgi:hypothetical protein
MVTVMPQQIFFLQVLALLAEIEIIDFSVALY